MEIVYTIMVLPSRWFCRILKALAESRADLLLCGEAYSLMDSIKSK